MSKALEVCIASLEKDLQLNTRVESSGEGVMALTVLAHIKDVLSGSSQGAFDEGVLKPLLQQRLNVVTSPSLPSPPHASPTIPVIPSSNTSTIASTSTIPIVRNGEPNLLLGNRNYQPSASLSRTPQTSSKPLPSPIPSTKVPISNSVTSPSNNRPSLSTTSSTKVIPANVDVNSGFPPCGFSTRSGVPVLNRGTVSRGEIDSLDADPLGALGGK